MSDALQAFETALEAHGIAVDSTMAAMDDVSLMYEYDSETELEDLVTVALLYAKVPQLSRNVLSVTPIDTSGQTDERIANYAIERELADRFNRGELSKESYLSEVRDTWRPYDSRRGPAETEGSSR